MKLERMEWYHTFPKKKATTVPLASKDEMLRDAYWLILTLENAPAPTI